MPIPDFWVQKRSNHAPVHDMQLGKRKFTFPKEVTFPVTFVNSFILFFH